MGLYEGNTRGEWKLTFGSDLRNKNSSFSGTLLQRGGGVFSPNSRAEVNNPSFLLHLSGSSPRNFQHARTEADSRSLQIRHATFSLNFFLLTDVLFLPFFVFLFSFFLSLPPQWSYLNWAEWGWGEGGERAALCKKKKNNLCKMWGMCTAVR